MMRTMLGTVGALYLVACGGTVVEREDSAHLSAAAGSLGSGASLVGQGGERSNPSSQASPPAQAQAQGGEGNMPSSDAGTALGGALQVEPDEPEPSVQPTFCDATTAGLSLTDWSSTVQATLAEQRAGLVGEWQGIFYNNFWAPYAVRLSFAADGSYSGQCLEHSDASGDGCCSAFSYGTDRDSTLKRWTLSTLDATGASSGEIDIIYYYQDDLFQESGYQGKLVDLQLDATHDRARFQFDYGDISVGSFDLQRVTH